MLRVLIGPNRGGKSKYLANLEGMRYLSDSRSGYARLQAIKSLCARATDTLIIDDVDAHIDIDKIEELMNSLISCKHDVWVSVHNPVFVNYMTDEEAIEGLMLVIDGKIKKYFDNPRLRYKLELMGPGEVMIDSENWGEDVS